MAPALLRNWLLRANRKTGLLRGFHRECVVEAVEVVEQPNGAEQFDHFAFIKILAKFVPQCIVHGMRVAAHALRQPQCCFLFGGKILALLEVCQVLDLLAGPA
jgi:hypothetical protein